MSLAAELIENQHKETELIRQQCRDYWKSGKRENSHPIGSRARRIWADEAERIMSILRVCGLKTVLNYLETGIHKGML